MVNVTFLVIIAFLLLAENTCIQSGISATKIILMNIHANFSAIHIS